MQEMIIQGENESIAYVLSYDTGKMRFTISTVYLDEDTGDTIISEADITFTPEAIQTLMEYCQDHLEVTA